MKICVLRKHPDSPSFVGRALEGRGHLFEDVVLSEKGIEKLNNSCVDAFVFDTTNDGGSDNDPSLLQSVRRITKTIPILLVTNSNEKPSYREKMLNVGVDGCIQVPFLDDELFVRLEKLIQKKGLLFNGTKVEAGAVSVDIGTHVVLRKGKTVSLTRAEYSILFHLFLHKNSLVSSEDLLGCLRENTIENSSTINTHIFNLRKKMPGFGLIKTVPLYGFMISDRFSAANKG